MRKLSVVVALVTLSFAVAAAGTSPTPTGRTWQAVGFETLRYQHYRQEEYPQVTAEFTDTGIFDFRVRDDEPLTGTWLRKGKRRFVLGLDGEGTENLMDLIGAGLTRATGSLAWTISPTKIKLKVKTRTTRTGASRLKLEIAVKFRELSDEKPVKGKWKLLFEANRSATPGPDPEPGPELVTQEMFRELPNRMMRGRSSHTQTLLPNGRVLIAGGFGSGETILRTAELFDPLTERFGYTGSLNYPRAGHTATRLDDGKVLIVGGQRPDDGRGLASVESFDPGIGGFRLVGSMVAERTAHTATLLGDGRVLVTGGRTRDDEGASIWHRTAEIYDPAEDTWSPTANDMQMLRGGHRATLLQDGTVLITGGSGTRVAELFDPATERFRTINARMSDIRSEHGDVLLPNGQVLLSDGGSLFGEVYDPETETFLRTDNSDSQYRYAAVTFPFRENEVLILGGFDYEESFRHGSMEQFLFDYKAGGRYFHIPALPQNGVYLRDPRAFSAWSPLADGRFLITGGLGEAWDEPDLDTAVIFDPGDEE